MDVKLMMMMMMMMMTPLTFCPVAPYISVIKICILLLGSSMEIWCYVPSDLCYKIMLFLYFIGIILFQGVLILIIFA